MEFKHVLLQQYKVYVQLQAIGLYLIILHYKHNYGIKLVIFTKYLH